MARRTSKKVAAKAVEALHPNYALDIARADASKPLTGRHF